MQGCRVNAHTDATRCYAPPSDGAQMFEDERAVAAGRIEEHSLDEKSSRVVPTASRLLEYSCGSALRFSSRPEHDGGRCPRRSRPNRHRPHARLEFLGTRSESWLRRSAPALLLTA